MSEFSSRTPYVVIGVEDRTSKANNGKQARDYIIVRVAMMGTGKPIETMVFDKDLIDSIKKIPLYVPVELVISVEQNGREVQIWLKDIKLKTASPVGGRREQATETIK